MLTRREAIVLLWMQTHLGAAEVIGAISILERTQKLPATHIQLHAAAWIAYKAYTTCASDKYSFFADHVLHGMQKCSGVAEEEMDMLQAIQFYVPSKTRADAVYELGCPHLKRQELDVGITLALLMPELCNSMTDEQYTRCVLFAAAYKAGKVVRALATKDVSKDFIMQWGLRIARQTE